MTAVAEYIAEIFILVLVISHFYFVGDYILVYI